MMVPHLYLDYGYTYSRISLDMNFKWSVPLPHSNNTLQGKNESNFLLIALVIIPDWFVLIGGYCHAYIHTYFFSP